ncbi:hypothetical protein [Actinoplanes sp. NPDC049681]|uniref:hypothetical protein n=1 Tax=Actinoplanes sp. NPDC049681 TaxID=3363905 RepID=UPI0037BA594D
MAVVDRVRHEEYWPEFGTVVVRDGVMPGEAYEYVPSAKALEEGGFRVGFGTVGRAGAGWLQLRCGSGPQQVTLEVHDEQPPQVGEGWAEVFETPYRSGSGSMGLTDMTDGPAWRATPLPGAGSYRVQVSHRWREDAVGEWRLSAWPQHPEQPPRWLRRPGVAERGVDPTSLAADVFAVAAWCPGHELVCTMEDLAQRLLVTLAQAQDAVAHAGNCGWLTYDGVIKGDGHITLRIPGGAEVVDPDAPLRRGSAREAPDPDSSPTSHTQAPHRIAIGRLSHLMVAQYPQNQTDPGPPNTD